MLCEKRYNRGASDITIDPVTMDSVGKMKLGRSSVHRRRTIINFTHLSFNSQIQIYLLRLMHNNYEWVFVFELYEYILPLSICKIAFICMKHYDALREEMQSETENGFAKPFQFWIWN